MMGKHSTVALFNAVNNNDLFGLQEVLMDHPDLDVNKAMMGSMAALHMAAEKGYSSCVKVLLCAGANVDYADEFGDTALMTGVSAGYPMVIQKLLDAHCDCNKVNHKGSSALHYAVKRDSVGVVQLLCQAGARSDIVDEEGHTPVSLALQSANVEMLYALLMGNYFVDVNQCVQNLNFPLLCLLKKNLVEMASVMLLSGYHGRQELAVWHKLMVKADSEVNERQSETCGTTNHALIKQFLLEEAPQPWTLKQFCRLVIRRTLNSDIPRKVSSFNLPELMGDFLCFRDLYRPIELKTDCEIYSFFADHPEAF